MAMRFGVDGSFGVPNGMVGGGPSTMPMLRAEGGLNYRQFIGLLKAIWEEVHPDVPIIPVQDNVWAVRPSIVYSLENRKTHSNEPKRQFREQIAQDGDQNIVVNGQRFDNYIAFSAVDTDPDTAEAIIETFEEFMLEYTWVFKRKGLSDIFYSRRLSDREETRTGEDVSVRTVVYMCIIEHVVTTPVDKLQKILTNVSIQLKPLGHYAWVESIPDHHPPFPIDIKNLSEVDLKLGDHIKPKQPIRGELLKVPNSAEVYIPGTNIKVEYDGNTFPAGLQVWDSYIVSSVSEDGTFQLESASSGKALELTSPGWFRFVRLDPITNGNFMETDIDDSIDTIEEEDQATPNS